MPSTRADQAENTRKAVLATARKLFVENGFDATSLQNIADEMGVTKANVYYYYPQKIAILEALLQPVLDALIERLDTAEQIHDRAERVDYLLTSWIELVVSAYRTIAPMDRTDPIMRRHDRIARELDALNERGLHLMFGARPTIDQQAACWLVSDLSVVIRRLTHLPDDQLRDALVRLCRTVIEGVDRDG